MKKLIVLLTSLTPFLSFAQENERGHESSNVLAISIILIGLYILSLILKKTKILKETLHRRILNIALLISFLLTAYSGMVLAIRSDYGIMLGEADDHVVWGIVMIWVGIFHAIERSYFFKNTIKDTLKIFKKNV